MTNITFEVTHGEPHENDFKALSAGLLSHHAVQGHPKAWQKYCIFLKDEQGTPLAGVIVTFMWNGMSINSLWVDEQARGHGYGMQLMEMAEKEAIKRGCTVAYTDTFPWQAPGFYEKLGYKLYGRLENFPQGSYLSYYSKVLQSHD